MTEITTPQAQDLARHFLGSNWDAWTRDDEFFLSHIGGPGYFVANSWRKVFRLAGVPLPARRHFAHVGRTVKNGRESVAECYSNSMAERIANALNAYTPDRRGT